MGRIFGLKRTEMKEVGNICLMRSSMTCTGMMGQACNTKRERD
jgi:hypothetical protein